MSDFDTALERLITDEAFRAALATDATAALAGYRLTADEHALLSSHHASAAIAQSTVESRTSKSSVFGMLSAFSGGSSTSEIPLRTASTSVESPSSGPGVPAGFDANTSRPPDYGALTPEQANSGGARPPDHGGLTPDEADAND